MSLLSSEETVANLIGAKSYLELYSNARKLVSIEGLNKVEGPQLMDLTPVLTLAYLDAL